MTTGRAWSARPVVCGGNPPFVHDVLFSHPSPVTRRHFLERVVFVRLAPVRAFVDQVAGLLLVVFLAAPVRAFVDFTAVFFFTVFFLVLPVRVLGDFLAIFFLVVDRDVVFFFAAPVLALVDFFTVFFAVLFLVLVDFADVFRSVAAFLVIVLRVAISVGSFDSECGLLP